MADPESPGSVAEITQLNLRNDQLRRRFDSLKYDLKRCEDVVYDLTLRGLTAGTAAEANGEKTNA
jgi:hypothetical protein